MLLTCPEKQVLGFFFAFGFGMVSFQGAYDPTYIAGKIFLFKIVEFQKQLYLRLFKTQT